MPENTPATSGWWPTRDFDGKPIAEMSAYELRRRLSILRANRDGHPTSRAYERAYGAALATRRKPSA